MTSSSGTPRTAGGGATIAGAAAADAPRGGRRRRVAPLDGVRAFAVVAVLLVHGGVSWAGGGFLGVDVFFVLSGFLITSLLCIEYQRHGTVRLGRFWAQRARRLLPALVVTLLGIAVYARVFASSTDLASLRADAIATLLYVANWHFILSAQNYFAASQQSPLLHTWSLAVEEQYYLIWPLVALFVLRRRGPRGLAAVAGVGALASAALMAALHGAGFSVDRLYYGTDTRAQALLVGSFLGASGIAPLSPPVAGWLPRLGRVRVTSRLVVAVGLVGMVALLWCCHVFGGGPAFLFEGGFLLVALAAAAVIASVAIVPESVLGRALSVGPVVFVGRISYGVYLYHWPLFLALNGAHTGLSGAPLLALRLAATFALATASFLFLEEPIRTHRFFARSQAAWLLAGVAALLVPTLVVSTEATAAPRVVTASRANEPISERSQLVAADAFTTDPIRMVLYGDSLGLTLGEGLSVDSAAHFGVHVVDDGSIGCDFDPTLLRRVSGTVGPIESGCPHWQTAWPRTAVADRAEVVGIVMGRWEVADHLYRGQWTHVGEPLWDHHLQDELAQAVSGISATGAKVVLFTMPDLDPSLEAPDGTPFPENTPQRAAAYNADVAAVARRLPNQVTVIDLYRLLDPDGHFTATIDAIPVRWTDGIHVSVPGGEWLQPRILPAVAALGLEVRHTEALAAHSTGAAVSHG